jgi:hypothetical protein
MLDTRVPSVVRIENASLDEGEDGTIVMRGKIARDTLRFLKVDHDYQRKLEARPDLAVAFRSGVVVPDIDVGVRGQEFRSEGADCVIVSPAFLVDGAQRVGTALAVLDEDPNLPIRIGALVHFGTTKTWEAARFTDLNLNTRKVSASLHLRNLRDRNTAILTLFGLSNSDPDCVLKGLVCWEQAMQRREITTALSLSLTALKLHAHLAGISNPNAAAVAARLQIVANKIGLQAFRENVAAFYGLIDEAFGLRNVEYRMGAPQVKAGFLGQFARLLSNHIDFWSPDGTVLQIDAATRRKIGTFPLNAPEVRQLAGASGAARDILYELLLKHINSGRREHRLTSRFEQ